MKKSIAAVLCAAVAACAGSPREETAPESRSEEKQKTHTSKIIGAAAGGGIGAYVAYGSTACAIGGPLCAIVVIPAVIFGGLIGGTAGAIGDATKDALANDRKDPGPPRAGTSERPGG